MSDWPEYEVISPASCKKPTTGEWTLAGLMDMVDAPEHPDWYSALTKIADAHNAALAAAIRAQMDKDDEMWSAKLSAERQGGNPATPQALAAVQEGK